MELGEKIRLARTEQNLSQRQLCGQEITRNMLSQIESGKARPSMTTLRYLAARLDKPVSWFLEEGDLRPTDAALSRARQAFQAGNFPQARQELALCREQTPEAALLEHLCLTELARQAIAQGKLPLARQLLEKAGSIDSVYKTAPLEAEAQLLSLEAGAEGPLPSVDRPLLLKARQALENRDPAAAIRYLEACDNQDPPWALLRGKAALAQGDHQTALTLLQQAQQAFPKEAIPLLEQTCKELEDYKQAYYYACLQR